MSLEGLRRQDVAASLLANAVDRVAQLARTGGTGNRKQGGEGHATGEDGKSGHQRDGRAIAPTGRSGCGDWGSGIEFRLNPRRLPMSGTGTGVVLRLATGSGRRAGPCICIDRERPQCHHRAPGVRTGGDAIDHRTHPQRVHGFVAAGAFGQEGLFALAFQPAAPRQVPAHAMRDRAGQRREICGTGRTGAVA